MPTLGDTLKALSRLPDQLQKRADFEAREPEQAARSPLREITKFGSNPGNLRMLAYVPEGLSPRAPLVVALHGCLQSAAGYDVGVGWSTLADRYGFALLMPEQRKRNNANRCFNWFAANDTRRGEGEASSIAQMIKHMLARHDLDRGRVFISGLSAGGAMTAAMLATYPELFAGGGIIAGLPFRAATSVQEAFEVMRTAREQTPRTWGDLVRFASGHKGPWPRISIWQGLADTTVDPLNARELVKQWADVHGLSAEPTRTETVDGFPRQVWVDRSGEPVIEFYTIRGMAHGAPLSVGAGVEQAGEAGDFLLDVGISSSFHLAKFWGLTGAVHEAARAERAEARDEAAADEGHSSRQPARAQTGRASDAEERGREPLSGYREARSQRRFPVDISGVINKALKAAGLLKSG